MVLLGFCIVAVTIAITTISIYYGFLKPRLSSQRPLSRKRGTKTLTLLVLGSGGHTAEMLMIFKNYDTALYTFRRYVVSSGDSLSISKAIEFEKTLEARAAAQGKAYGTYDIKTVRRARNVHQSLLTTPFSALKCLRDCITVLHSPVADGLEPGSCYPDIILTNGPATATIMILAAKIVKLLGPVEARLKMRVIFIESWARVRTLSLSGKILEAFGACDRFVVQWKTLEGSRREYKGQLLLKRKIASGNKS